MHTVFSVYRHFSETIVSKESISTIFDYFLQKISFSRTGIDLRLFYMFKNDNAECKIYGNAILCINNSADTRKNINIIIFIFLIKTNYYLITLHIYNTVKNFD